MFTRRFTPTDTLKEEGLVRPNAGRFGDNQ